MNKRTSVARLQGQQDCRACMVFIGFVYSPLVLMLGAAAVIGLS